MLRLNTFFTGIVQEEASTAISILGLPFLEASFPNKG